MIANGEIAAAMSPLVDLYLTRTNRDRNGTIPDKWNNVLLVRDLDRLISEGIVERVTNLREISSFEYEKTWYKEIATGNVYVHVAAWERGAPEFRRHVEVVAGSNLVQ